MTGDPKPYLAFGYRPAPEPRDARWGDKPSPVLLEGTLDGDGLDDFMGRLGSLFFDHLVGNESRVRQSPADTIDELLQRAYGEPSALMRFFHALCTGEYGPVHTWAGFGVGALGFDEDEEDVEEGAGGGGAARAGGAGFHGASDRQTRHKQRVALGAFVALESALACVNQKRRHPLRNFLARLLKDHKVPDAVGRVLTKLSLAAREAARVSVSWDSAQGEFRLEDDVKSLPIFNQRGLSVKQLSFDNAGLTVRGDKVGFEQFVLLAWIEFNADDLRAMGVFEGQPSLERNEFGTLFESGTDFNPNDEDYEVVLVRWIDALEAAMRVYAKMRSDTTVLEEIRSREYQDIPSSILHEAVGSVPSAPSSAGGRGHTGLRMRASMPVQAPAPADESGEGGGSADEEEDEEERADRVGTEAPAAPGKTSGEDEEGENEGSGVTGGAYEHSYHQVSEVNGFGGGTGRRRGGGWGTAWGSVDHSMTSPHLPRPAPHQYGPSNTNSTMMVKHDLSKIETVVGLMNLATMVAEVGAFSSHPHAAGAEEREESEEKEEKEEREEKEEKEEKEGGEGLGLGQDQGEGKGGDGGDDEEGGACPMSTAPPPGNDFAMTMTEYEAKAMAMVNKIVWLASDGQPNGAYHRVLDAERHRVPTEAR